MSKNKIKTARLVWLLTPLTVILLSLGPGWAQTVNPSASEKKEILEPEEAVLSDARENKTVEKVTEEKQFPQKKQLVPESGGGPEEILSVNFENVDIRDVIRILADKAQLNMVVGPDVSAMVNIQLNNVRWQQALDVILTTYNLTYKKDGDLIRIMTLENLQAENEKIPLITKIITLNFARAGEVKGNFGSMLSSRGKIDVNDRTNSLIVIDLPDRIATIEQMANRLDTRTPQVMIEALMADVVIGKDDQLGINWDLAWPDTVQGGGLGDPVQKRITQNFGALGPPGSVIWFGTTLLTNKDLHSTIRMWQEQRRVNVLAHPQILTLDNLAAKIDLTEEIPYTQVTQSTEGGAASALSTTAFKSAGINLTVTPHITTKDNFIYLNLSVKHSFQSGTAGVDQQPIIDSRSAETNLLVKNKQTAVIGGLRKLNDSFTVDKIPILGDIPLLGSLFRKRTGALTNTDLLVFVTPTIVEEMVFTPKQKDRLDLFQEEPEDWTSQFNAIKQKKPPPKQTVMTQEKGQEEKPEDYFYLRPPALDKSEK